MEAHLPNDPPSDPSEEMFAEFDLRRMQHENVLSDTWHEQHQIEQRVFDIRHSRQPHKPLVLYRDKHISWLMRNLQYLPRGAESFDVLQGWASFWIIHSLNLLGATIPLSTVEMLIEHFNSFKDPVGGGYGGGPGQSSHLASTFSVLMAICSLGTEEALMSIDSVSLLRFLLQMKQPDGSFRVSYGGETDVRASYCAIAVASIVGLLEGDEAERLTRGSASYLKSLQGFDGGIGGEPGTESHGGNSYCGVASLVILGQLEAIDTEAMLDWAVMRQMGYEGGFQGRTNKLVDSCYSFWVGALFPLLATGKDASAETAKLFDADVLQRYVLECAQLENGGLRDKPGTSRDFMHSCYALSGLSIAQHYGGAEYDQRNEVKKVNPVFNLTEEKYAGVREFFSR